MITNPPNTNPPKGLITGNQTNISFTTTDQNVYGYEISIVNAANPNLEYFDSTYNGNGSKSQNITVPYAEKGSITLCTVKVRTFTEGGMTLGTGTAIVNIYTP